MSTIKELLIQEINQMSDTEPILEELWSMIERKKQRFWKGGQDLGEDLKKLDCSLPKEAAWKEEWDK